MKKKPRSNNMLVIGNAEDDGNESYPKGWFVGHFINGLNGLRCTKSVEVKWGKHQQGEAKEHSVANKKGITLTLLVHGHFSLDFYESHGSIELRRPGDYVIFEPGVLHRWASLEDSIVITVRWPSLPNDQETYAIPNRQDED